MRLVCCLIMQGNVLAFLKMIKNTLTLPKQKPILDINAISLGKFKNFLRKLNPFISKSMKKYAIYA